jgi:hypothetical protein
MKKFILVAMLAAVVVAGEKPPAPAGTDSQKDGSFVTHNATVQTGVADTLFVEWRLPCGKHCSSNRSWSVQP